MNRQVSALAWLALAAALCVSTAFGSIGWLTPEAFNQAIFELRLARSLGCALAGASLGIAGALMQTLLANELADPYVLGLSGGAALGAVVSVVVWPALHPGWLAAALAWLCAALTAKWNHGDRNGAITLVRGMLLGGVLSAATGLVLFLLPESSTTRTAQNWLFGGLHAASPLELALMAGVLVFALHWTKRHVDDLDRLLFGRDVASTLGVDVRQLGQRMQQIAALLTAMAVVAGGLIGFVGWMAPHLARSWGGANHRALLPLSAFIGAMTLLVADLLARTVAAPRELPVGLLTALLIAPLVFYWHKRGFVW